MTTDTHNPLTLHITPKLTLHELIALRDEAAQAAHIAELEDLIYCARTELNALVGSSTTWLITSLNGEKALTNAGRKNPRIWTRTNGGPTERLRRRTLKRKVSNSGTNKWSLCTTRSLTTL